MIIPPWAYAAAAAVTFATGFGSAWQIQQWRWEAKQADALREAQIAFQRRLDAINKEASDYERERDVARAEGRARETAIRTIYRNVPVPAECEPPADALRVLDDALRSANARTGGEPGATVPDAAGTP